MLKVTLIMMNLDRLQKLLKQRESSKAKKDESEPFFQIQYNRRKKRSESGSRESRDQKKKKQNHKSSHRSKNKKRKQKKNKKSLKSSSSSQSSNSSSSSSRSRQKQKEVKRPKSTSPKKQHEAKKVEESRSVRPKIKINSGFLSNLIIDHKFMNRRLDDQDIKNAGQKLQKNFNQSRRPVTMSQFLSNESLRLTPLKQKEKKIYKCELEKCLKQFTQIGQFQKHIEKHKQQI